MSIYQPKGKKSKDAHKEKTGEGQDGITKRGVSHLWRVKKGKKVPVPIRTFANPYAHYGPLGGGVGAGEGEEGEIIGVEPGDEEGDGKEGSPEGDDHIYGEVNKEEILNYLRQNLELEMIKKGKKLKPAGLRFPFVIKQGLECLLDLNETVDEAIFRQIVWDLPINPAELEEDDLRYWTTKPKYKEESEAVVIFKRDVSGSVSEEEMRMSYALTALIEYWLEDQYKEDDGTGNVTSIYLPHNQEAWEETLEGYFNLKSSGGTDFASAYNVVMAMINGDDYRRSEGVSRKHIDANAVDIYLVDMTDGMTWSHDEAVESLGNLMPHLTRMCYLETHFGYHDKTSDFQQMINQTFETQANQGQLRVFEMDDIEQIPDAMETFFGKRGKK
jgi:uncharacterized sporulation protein YeaH/YhbH (DUF444 family)